MNEYTVTLVAGRINLTTVVYADDKRHAQSLAYAEISDAGISIDDETVDEIISLITEGN